MSGCAGPARGIRPVAIDLASYRMGLDPAEVRTFKRSLEKPTQLEGLETALELKLGPPARPLLQRMQNYSLDALQELRRKLLDEL